MLAAGPAGAPPVGPTLDLVTRAGRHPAARVEFSADSSPAAHDGAVVLEDPVALRALAHPARQRLLAELFAGNVLTATDAADMVGLTPSAVSHHLRALAKYGLAERAEATGDGRERPWRATGSSFSMAMPEGPAGVRALQTVTGTAIASAAEELDALLEGRVGEPWRGHRGISREELWLTRDETKEFGDALAALIDRFTDRRHAGNHPTGSRRTGLTVLFVPLEDPPAGDAAPAADAQPAAPTEDTQSPGGSGS
jgi:DNA-binding transcriptional ArsR family regulator